MNGKDILLGLKYVGDEHRHAAAGQSLFQNIDGIPAWLSVKNVACQQHEVTVFPPTQVGNFPRERFLLLPQKLALGFGKAPEGGIQMQVSRV